MLVFAGSSRTLVFTATFQTTAITIDGTETDPSLSATRRALAMDRPSPSGTVSHEIVR